MFNEGPPPQIWYGRLNDNIVLSEVELNGQKVITADTLQFVHWEVLEDTMLINGIVCQKAAGRFAIGNKKLAAWFAPSIPTSVAPYTLRGLPGLIFEVTTEDNAVEWKLLQLYWPLKETVKWRMPDRKSIVSKEEQKRLMDKHNAAAWELIEQFKKQEKDRVKKN